MVLLSSAWRGKTANSSLLDVARFQADNCERPRRNRKVVQYYALVIELLAWVCPWIRLYSRWVTVRSFDVDDWLMLVSNVRISTLLQHFSRARHQVSLTMHLGLLLRLTRRGSIQ